MRESSWTAVAALALSIPCVPGAEAALLRAPRLSGDVTATECVRGGGVLVIPAGGEGAGPVSTRCRGGTHDGQAIT
jgi:hypothetical protein